MEEKMKSKATRTRYGTLPISKVGIMSYMFISWFSGLVVRIYRNHYRALNEDDFWQCSEEEGIQVNKKCIQKLWKFELEKNKNSASLWNVWVQFTVKRNLLAICVFIIYALSSFAKSAFLVNKIVQYIESDENSPWYGVGLIVAVFCSEFLRALSRSNMLVLSCQTGTRFRSGLIGVVYDKLLRRKSFDGIVISEVMNAFSVDIHRVYMMHKTNVYLIGFPIYFVIGSVYCYVLIGYWCVVPIVIFALFYITQSIMGQFITVFRKKCVQYSDIRIRRMGEAINNMMFIKLNGWETPILKAIKDARMQELTKLLYAGITTSFMVALIPITPTIAATITISIYAASGNPLTASTVFSLIGVINCQREIFAKVPLSLKALNEAKVSMARVRALLMSDDYSPPDQNVLDTSNSVEIYGADFMLGKYISAANDWTNKTKYKGYTNDVIEHTPCITNMNFDVKKGKLIGICGAVGSGKSALMSMILGRIEKSRGHVAVNGNIAYVGQQVWISNCTLKDNILFGQKYDLKRFNEVIRCCCLEQDVSRLPDGVETEIGERGANLSGGQKQRVSLARAVYSDRDVYLLDSPLSAVDSKVGKQIFQDCIKGVLRTKTVLMATHNIQYLRQCDEIVVMDKLSIVQRGHHEELIAHKGTYVDLFNLKSFTANEETNTNEDCISSDGFYGMDHFYHAESKGESKPTFGESNNACIVAENIAVGKVTYNSYKAYIQAAGGPCIVVLALCLHMVSSSTIIFSDWWLSKWVTAYENRDTMSVTTSSLLLATTTNLTSDPTSNDVSLLEDDVSLVPQSTYLLVYNCTLLGLFIMQIVKAVTEAKVANRASKRIHDKCAGNIMKATMDFFQSNPVGRILNRFSRDLDEIDVYLPQMIQELLTIMTLIVLSMIMSIYLTPWLLVAVFPIVTIFYFLQQISSVSTRQLKRFEHTSRSPLMSEINKTTEGLVTIVTYDQQNRFTKSFNRVGNVASMSQFLFDVGIRWVVLRFDLLAGLLTTSASAIFVLKRGLLSPALAGLVLTLLSKTTDTIRLFVQLSNSTEAHFTAMERLHEYTEKIELEKQGGEKQVDEHWLENGGAIKFHNVCVRYRASLGLVLRSVSFKIKSGEKVGIVGRTGAGKSTIVKTLSRLVEVDAGCIFVDNENVSKLPLATVRSHIATITQDPVLFAGTIRYNLDPHCRCSDEIIWSALEKVHMKLKIQHYPEGIETLVTENGENFSLGERQLLCLARVLIQSIKVLILDEATGNVDTSTDVLIQQTIREAFSHCTVLTIAHRLSTVLQCDQIILMDAGKVIEHGPPNDLYLNKESLFRAMISAQAIEIP